MRKGWPRGAEASALSWLSGLYLEGAASSVCTQLENANNRTGHVSIGLAQPDPFYPLHVWRFFPRVPEKKVTNRTPSATLLVR